jgi:hypothetical protein
MTTQPSGNFLMGVSERDPGQEPTIADRQESVLEDFVQTSAGRLRFRARRPCGTQGFDIDRDLGGSSAASRQPTCHNVQPLLWSTHSPKCGDERHQRVLSNVGRLLAFTTPDKGEPQRGRREIRPWIR